MNVVKDFFVPLVAKHLGGLSRGDRLRFGRSGAFDLRSRTGRTGGRMRPVNAIRPDGIRRPTCVDINGP